MGVRAGYGIVFGEGDTTATLTEDHIFESTTVRDAFFNPDRLNELITGTPIVINAGSGAQFQIWGGTTNPTTYDSSQWTDSLNITGAQIVNLVNAEDDANILTDDQSNAIDGILGLTENRIPAASPTGLKDTNHRLIGNDLFVAGRLISEAGTVSLGELVNLSESGGFLSLVNAIDGARYNFLDYLVPTTAASSKPRRLALTGSESRVVLSSETDTSNQSRELTATYTTSANGRINALIVNTSLGYTNLRIRISNVSPDNAIAVKYIPSRQAWIDGSGGLTTTGAGEKIIRIDDSPLIYDNGRQYSITYRMSSGDL